MIEIKFTIEDIDYDSMADMMVPMLREKAENGELPGWMRLLFVAGGMSGEAVKKIMQRIPDDSKEKFIAKMLDENGDEAAKMLEEMAMMNGIGLKISDVNASVKNGGK